MKSENSRPAFSTILPVLIAVVVLGTGFAVFRSANATILPPAVVVSSASLQEHGSELVLNFEDREDAHGVCAYFVKRFQYIARPGIMMIDLGTQKPCLNDAIGKRAGVFKWNLPAELKGSGTLKVVLNHSRVGTVTVDHDHVTFETRFDRSGEVQEVRF